MDTSLSCCSLCLQHCPSFQLPGKQSSAPHHLLQLFLLQPTLVCTARKELPRSGPSGYFQLLQNSLKPYTKTCQCCCSFVLASTSVPEVSPAPSHTPRAAGWRQPRIFTQHLLSQVAEWEVKPCSSSSCCTFKKEKNLQILC